MADLPEEKKNDIGSGSGKKSRRAYWTVVAVIAVIVVILNVTARLCTPFADWYTRYVMPLWLNSLGRLTNLFPFSVGEWMAFIAANSLIVAAILWIPALILFLCKKAAKFRRFTAGFYRVYLMLLCFVALIMTLNCFIAYQCAPLDPNPERTARQYTAEELFKVYDYVTQKLNEYAPLQERDADGWLIADVSTMSERAADALRALSDRYPRLAGWYPDAKPLFFSNIVTHMSISGYFYPFSMEANYNKLMYESNYDTFAHELAHTHGYMFEDEANFLAFAACTESDDPFLIYCGYLGVYGYLYDDTWESFDALDSQLGPDEFLDIYPKAAPDVLIWHDWYFLRPDVREQLNKDDETLTDIISEETISDITENVSDASMKWNGVKSGWASYGEVVKQLLEYYDGKLY